MNGVTANLKTLYQCPALWFWNVIGLFLLTDAIVDPLFEPVVGKGEFVEYLLVSFWVGMITGSMVKESWGKPFSFCLPDHRRATRSMIFLVGIVANVLLSPLVLRYPGLDGSAALLGMISAACLGMVVYLLTVSGMFLIVHAGALWGIPVVFFGIFRSTFAGAHAAMEQAALFHPGVNAAVLVPIALVVWNRLGSPDVARRHSGTTFIPLQYIWNRVAMERYTVQRRLLKLERQSRSLWRGFEGRFLAGMSRLPALSGKRHARGFRYLAAGGILASSITTIVLGALVVVLLVVILGFIPPMDRHEGVSKANILYIVPCFLGLAVTLPLYSTMMVPAGRKERYRSCLSLGIHAGAIGLLISAAICCVSHAVGRLLPSVTFGGGTLLYLPMDPDMILAPLILFPLLLACQVLFPRHVGAVVTVLMIGVTIVGLATPGKIFLQISYVALLIPVALCWWVFAGALHHYSYHQDLSLG